MKEDFLTLKKAFEKEINQENRIQILKNFKEKLLFINKNPFSIDSDKNGFLKKILPIHSKTQHFIQNLKGF